ncbi:MAG: hypothetical protein U9Q76_06580 [candidate division WOR-3 bacterium]|nr:hypothetical protein [candidate division WOR-3 bacterium]
MHGSLHLRPTKRRAREVFLLVDNPFEEIGEEKVEFIPPLLGKDFKHKPYQEVWRGARRRLANYCDNLIIIGYSMPATDLWARSLLFWRHKPFGKEHAKKYLKKLIVVNPNVEVRNRTLRMLRYSIDTHTRVMVFDTFKEFAEFLPEVSEPSSDSE